MIGIKHQKLNLPDHYRCIVISDVHSHLDRLIQLLKEVDYTRNDYLIINGDFVEKGTQTLQTIDYLKRLSQENDKVYLLLGNCEYAIETLVNDDRYANQMIHYLHKIGKSGMIDQVVTKLKIDLKNEEPVKIQQLVRQSLKSYIDYLQTLPTTLETQDFLFVHAGIEKRQDWQYSSRSSFTEMRNFQKEGHLLNKYVIVGHLPTSNFYSNQINNDIMIDKNKKIISIDGGTGVKFISQLNALIIEGHHRHYHFTHHAVQPLPEYKVVDTYLQNNQRDYKVAWPHFEVIILEAGEDFSLCLQIDTKNQFSIKNEFLYHKNHKTYCLDDYTNHFVSVQKGNLVKLIGIYVHYAYIIKNKEVGWIPAHIIKKI